MLRVETAIVGGLVATHTAVFPATVAIAGGRIGALLAPEVRTNAEEVIDATDRLVLPGCVDPHVHFNEPGRTQWEGFEAGTRSAAAGGVTTVIEMPLNAVPPTTDAAAFSLKAAAAGRSAVVDYALWGGLVPGNADALTELHEAGVVAYKAFMVESGTEFARVDDGVLWEGMKRVAGWGGIVGVHAENNALALLLRGRLEGVGRRDFRAWGESRPPEVELEAIQRALFLARSAGCRLHIVHLSVPQGGACVASARGAGQRVTVETCPHYLLLDEEAAARLGPVAKCAPPLRPRAAVEGLWRQVVDGTIDWVASDHSPCPPEEKTRGADDIWAAWGGITGVQTLLPLMVWEGVRRRGLPLERLVALTSTNAARTFGLFPRKGSLLPGADADVVLFDYHREWTISADRLLYRHPWTPYLGWRIVGAVDRVLVRGRLVFANGEIVASPGSGRLIRPQGARGMPRDPSPDL
ncbi:MAG TPA: allantoinase AllB [bacterium]|nr:allantoinase AllB [bacterium]